MTQAVDRQGSNDDGGLESPRFVFVPAPHYPKAREWLFVLQSVGLDAVIRPTEDGRWGLQIVVEHGERAIANLRAYEAENRDWPPHQAADRPLYAGSAWAATILGSLALFFQTTGPARLASEWFRRGTASADEILHGKPWQAVTALTLHADAQHVLGNALAGTLFLSAVHRRLGVGLGTFAVLAAGILGNVFNALWYGAHHRSIGASTAVFGAVGVLAATQALLNRRDAAARPALTTSRLALTKPLVGGLALLGLLGASGANTDLLAHLFGFGAGLLTGAAAGLAVRRRTAPLASLWQYGFASLSASLVIGAWALAWWR
ncbi:MAG: rhomboid family intramembrane serine protease [Myxococcales bacterium]|nr:MAG: rhomboid family intramembrane serine protease [Myxococcales bacterium]